MRVIIFNFIIRRKLKIGNKNCSLKPLIGCPFGTVFQLDSSSDGPFLSPLQSKGMSLILLFIYFVNVIMHLNFLC